jgi:hypothetical protein
VKPNVEFKPRAVGLEVGAATLELADRDGVVLTSTVVEEDSDTATPDAPNRRRLKTQSQRNSPE